MSRYEDGYPARGRADDYYTYSANGGAPPPSYLASPGHTTYNGKPQARLTYEPHETYYPSRSPSRSAGQHRSRSGSRPRLEPPPSDGRRERERGDNRYGDSDDSDDGRMRSPLEMAKRFVGGNFTDSTTGLGVGVLGALVGGLAAREAVELTSNRQKEKGGRPRDEEEEEQHRRNQLISTVVGAAVGALGANAVEKRMELRRARDEVEQRKRERRWRRPEGADAEVLEKIEVIARPRGFSRDGRLHGDHGGDWDAWDEHDGERDGERDYERDHERDHSHGRDDDPGRAARGRHGIAREVDPGARSWKSVEDWRRGLA